MFDSTAGRAWWGGEGTASSAAGAAVRGVSRASRGDPGWVWPPRDARDVRGARVWQKADTKSDFRDRFAREKRGRAGVVDEDAGNVTLSGPQRAGIEALKRAA
jgi:hypothetical protein